MTDQREEAQRTIAQINAMVKGIVEIETLEHFFWVGGKVERYHKSDLGHVYFELVDEKKRIKCMLPERHTGNISYEIKNGIKIEVYGDVQVYEDRAEIQIQVLDARLIDDNGISTITGLEQLRKDGLFPTSPKNPPTQIRRIGIITSKSSRAVGDFENAYRSVKQRVILAPYQWQYVMLEGDRAVNSIIDGIQKLNRNPEIDLIAIIRGGGRHQNLAVFDDVDIARAIAQSPKYIVTGIGHHKDSTLADQVADESASTPTSVANYIAKLCLESQGTSTVSRPTVYMTLLLIVFAVMFVIIVVLLLINFQ